MSVSVIVDRRCASVIDSGTVYGPPPTRNVGPGGEFRTCAAQIPGDAVGTADGAGVGTGSVGTAGGAGVGAAAGGWAAGGVSAGGVVGCTGGGTKTVPGTGDEPGGATTVVPPGPRR